VQREWCPAAEICNPAPGRTRVVECGTLVINGLGCNSATPP
jgi:hypothetical protein